MNRLHAIEAVIVGSILLMLLIAASSLSFWQAAGIAALIYAGNGITACLAYDQGDEDATARIGRVSRLW